MWWEVKIICWASMPNLLADWIYRFIDKVLLKNKV